MKKLYLLFLLSVVYLTSIGQGFNPQNLPYAAYKEGAQTQTLKSAKVPVNFAKQALANDAECKIDALLLAADADTWVADVQTYLMNTGMFNLVDMANNTTPTLATLRNYDAILVWTDNSLNDTVGDTLAAYIDKGGGVVSAVFNLFTGWGIEGTRFNTDYLLLNLGNYASGATTTLGTVYDASHPIMDGVTSLVNPNEYRSNNATMTAGSVVVAEWSDGLPLVVVKENLGPANARRADVNIFPPSSNARGDLWDASTDGDILLANALLWVSKKFICDDIEVENDPGVCGAVVNYPTPKADGATVTQIDASGLTSGDEFPVGVTIQEYEFDFGGGVIETISFTVTINDTEPPVIDCPEDIVVSNDPGECCAVVNFPDLGNVITGEAKPGITLPNAPSNQGGVAYNPEKKLYYAVRAGSSSYILYTYDENGTQLPGNAAGFDFRGLWWNPNTSSLEGNSYNSKGYRRVDLDANGYALSTGTNDPTSNYQPNSQSQADYDYDLDEVIYYHNNSIYRTSRATGTLIGSPIGITSLPANTLNSTFVGYTGIPGEEVLIYDYSNKAVYFADKTTGVYSRSVHLPSSAPGQSTLNTSYSNGHIWITDGTVWRSYKIVDSGVEDNCGNATATYDYPSGTCFPVGTTEVTITATDDAGNVSTCTFNVTVEDTTPPVLVAPADIEIEADENCEWDTNTEITGMATASDNCSGEAGVSLNYSDVEEDMGGGVIIITRTWTATDASGNTASDQQVITVTGGNAPPELVLNEIDIYLTESGQWTLNQFDIAALTAGSVAGCGVEDDLNFVVNPRYFHCADVFAPVEITVIASDSRGNSASGKVYLNVYDTIAPIAYCKDTTIYLGSFGQTLIVPSAVNMGGDRESVPEWARYHNNLEGGSIDACGIQFMDLSKQIFTCNDIGENVVTLTVYDPSGNFATCQAVVTVIDPIAPVFEPVSDIEYVVEPGICETSIPYPQITANDICPVVPELVEGFGPAGMFPLGTTKETWKAVDASGNEAWLTFNVTVKTYNAPPTIAAIEDIVVDEDPILIEIPLTNITPNVDCDNQQIISLQVSTDNPELITALNLEYVMGETTGTLLVTVGPNMNGEAWVTLTVKDNGGIANGGSDTTVETFKITVVPVPDAPEVTPPVVPIAINPEDDGGTNNDDARGAESITTDVEVTEKQFEIKMYPNPSKGMVNIEMTWNDIRKVEVTVYNMVGAKVFTKEYLAGSLINFDLSKQVTGMYMVRIDIEGLSVIKKLILDRK